jgi:lipid II:glycine glycyltransferase (peptidoglycan interpeptide bridge formation enzyme)
MWRFMYPQTLALFIAEHRGRPVGALLALKFNDTVSFEYLGYSEREQHLRPGHLLYFTAIEKACEEGYGFVDFRKTPAGNEGLLQFKRRWGTEERDISYFYYPSVPKDGPGGNGALARKLFGLINRPLPFVLARQLGRVIYRYMR